ncbi:MAG: T9SS type A sorting domain-containing protein [Bacteroidia bacterium]|jgi:hypothetical protein
MGTSRLAAICLSLTLVLVSFSKSINSQSITFGASSPVVITAGAEEYEIERQIPVTNSSNEYGSFHVRRRIVQNIQGSTNFFCWTACYLPSVSQSPTPLDIEGGNTTNVFSVHLRPDSMAGTAEIHYTFYNAQNEADSSVLVVKFDIAPLSSPNVKATEWSVKTYPNPVSDILNITCNGLKKNTELEIFNMLGTKVLSETLIAQNTNHQISLVNLPSGVYIYRLQQGSKALRTGKITIKH